MVPKNEIERDGDLSDSAVAEIEAGNHGELAEFDPMDNSLMTGLTSSELGRSKYDDDELRQIVNFDDFLAKLGETVDHSSDFLGSGGELINGTQLDKLVDKKFLFIQWAFIDSKEYDSWFVLAEVITEDHKRFTFASGTKFSLRDQLAQHTLRTGRRNGYLAEKGLSRRDYQYPAEPEPGEKTQTVYVYSIAR